MKNLPVLIAVIASASMVHAATYLGNGKTGFGGPVGNGSLTFTDDGTTLFGTINNNLGDELVIYIDSKAGGFTTTSTFTDTGGGGDILRKATSGYDGTLRATLNFAAGFGADLALAISPVQAQFGALFTLDTVGNFTYGSNGSNGSLNLTPTGTATGPFTFSIALANLGVTPGSSFDFISTYGNFHNDIYRSNEAYVTTFTGTTNPDNNFGTNTATATSFSTYITTVPEPSAFAMLLGGAGLLITRRRRQS